MPRWVKARRVDLQVRARRRVHRRAARPCTSSGSTAPSRSACGGRSQVSARATSSPRACPTRPTLGDRMHGKTCAGLLGDRHRQGRPAARGVPAPRRRQRVVDGRVRQPVRGLADGGEPGHRPGAARRRAPGRARACSARRRSTRCRSSTGSAATACLAAPGTGARRSVTSAERGQDGQQGRARPEADMTTTSSSRRAQRHDDARGGSGTPGGGATRGGRAGRRPDRALHRRRVAGRRPAASTFAVDDPSTGEVLDRGRRRHASTDGRAALDAAVAAQAGLGGDAAARARRDPAPRRSS